MKKMLIMALVLGIASTADALIVQLGAGGVTNGPGVDLPIYPSVTVVQVVSDSSAVPYVLYVFAPDVSKLDIIDVVARPAAGSDSAVNDFLDALGPGTRLWGMQAVDDWCPFGFCLSAGIQFDVHISGSVGGTLQLLDESLDTVLDSVTIVRVPPDETVYVDGDANGENDGSSWSNAFTRLQDALSLAAEYSQVREVRVAQGTYRPAGPGGDREASFEVNDLVLKGGYAGAGQPDPDARDVRRYRTVLSGDLNGDDGPEFTNISENSAHVVRTDGELEVDGFTITGGYGGSGAGMRNGEGAGVTARNCTFKANYSFYGAAVYNSFESDVNFIDCMFIGNRATQEGGAIWSGHYTNITLTNCTFTRNQASDNGGAMRIQPLTDALLTNCILWANTDSSGTDWSAQVSGGTAENLVMNYSCIQGWIPGLGGIGNIASDPCFADPDNGDYHLKSQAGRFDRNEGRWMTDDVTSPCIDAGDSMSPIGFEPFPNGGIVNMGVYGGSAEASKSYFGKPPCGIVVTGDVNGDCVVDFLDFRLMALHWREDNNP